jgi:valyl-tRNA synthetase
VKTVWKVADADNAVPGFYNPGELPETTNWIPQPDNAEFATRWFRNNLNKATEEINKAYQNFRLSEALKILYTLIWDDFCSWYLEWIKPEYGQPIDFQTHKETLGFFEELIQLLHPFMPFVTEEIYHLLEQRIEGDDLCMKQYNSKELFIDKEVLNIGELAKNGIATIRDLRSKLQLKSKEIINPKIKTETPNLYKPIESVIMKMTSSGSLDFVQESIPQAIGATSGSDMIYIPISTTTTTTTLNPLIEQRKKLEAELDHHKKFLQSVLKKLTNEQFMQNAKPEIVNLEKRKREDAEQKIKSIEESLLDMH